jgi:hypothetical protein
MNGREAVRRLKDLAKTADLSWITYAVRVTQLDVAGNTLTAYEGPPSRLWHACQWDGQLSVDIIDRRTGKIKTNMGHTKKSIAKHGRPKHDPVRVHAAQELRSIRKLAAAAEVFAGESMSHRNACIRIQMFGWGAIFEL